MLVSVGLFAARIAHACMRGIKAFEDLADLICKDGMIRSDTTTNNMHKQAIMFGTHTFTNAPKKPSAPKDPLRGKLKNGIRIDGQPMASLWEYAAGKRSGLVNAGDLVNEAILSLMNAGIDSMAASEAEMMETLEDDNAPF